MVRQPFTDQSALCGKLVLAFEERKVLVLVVDRLVIIEHQADEIATLRRYVGDKQVGFDADDLAFGYRRGRYGGNRWRAGRSGLRRSRHRDRRVAGDGADRS